MDVSNWTNLSDYDYPSMEMVGSEGQAALIALYSVTALLALVGNATVILVLVLGKRSARGLRVFLINLATTDITMSVFSIPFTYTSFMLGRWLFDPGFCPVVVFMQHVSVTGSVYTLTAIGMDRYYAIMYPLRSRWTKNRELVIVLSIWCLAVAVSIPQLTHSSAELFPWEKEQWHYECKEKLGESDGRTYTVLIFVVTFVLPLLLLAFTYLSIAVTLWRRSSPGNANSVRDRQQLAAKIKVVKMLALVVVMFAVCWLPLQAFNLLVHLDPTFSRSHYEHQRIAFTVTFFTCHWLSMANSFVNPIIYCFMSDNFWGDLRLLVFRCVRLLSGAPHGQFANSFRSTTYVMSYRKNSAGSHGSVQLRRLMTERLTEEDPSTRVTTIGRNECASASDVTDSAIRIQ